jgi:hypothetical protein
MKLSDRIRIALNGFGGFEWISLDVEKLENEIEENYLYHCSCDEWFDSKEELDKHREERHGIKPMKRGFPNQSMYPYEVFKTKKFNRGI